MVSLPRIALFGLDNCKYCDDVTKALARVRLPTGGTAAESIDKYVLPRVGGKGQQALFDASGIKSFPYVAVDRGGESGLEFLGDVHTLLKAAKEGKLGSMLENTVPLDTTAAHVDELVQKVEAGSIWDIENNAPILHQPVPAGWRERRLAEGISFREPKP